MRLFLITIFALVPAASLAQTFDASTECPGESSPRSDVTVCRANLDSTNCTTGKEALCFTDNGYSAGLADDCTIKFDASGPTPDGYIECEVAEGGTGFSDSFTLPATQDEIGVRYYVKFDEGWADYWSNLPHGIQLNTAHNASGGCAGGGTIEQPARPLSNTTDTWETYFTGCANTYVPVLQNTVFNTGRWYRIEMYAKKDTSCTDNTDAIGCNGTMEVYVDDVLISTRSDLNWVGAATAGTGGTGSSGFSTVQWPRRYFHARGKAGGQRVSFAGFALSNDADLRIDGDPSETLGSSTTTPKLMLAGIEPFVTSVGDSTTSTTSNMAVGNNKSRHLRGDCTGPAGAWIRGGVTSTDGTGWSVGYDSTINSLRTDWETLDLCSSGGTTYTPSDNSLEFTATSATEHVFVGAAMSASFGGAGSWPWTNEVVCIGGDIYVPSGNNYADAPTFAGFYSDDGSGGAGSDSSTDGERIALAINSAGNFALVFRDPDYAAGVQTQLAESIAAQADTWYSYEICLNSSDEVAFNLAGTEVQDFTALPGAFDWRVQSAYIGISNYNQSGTLTVYHDNIYFETASRVTCDSGYGWGSDCPASTLVSALGAVAEAVAAGGNAFFQSIGIPIN